MRIASVIAWTIVGITAIGWLAIAGTAYLSGNWHGMQECHGRALFLSAAFWLFCRGRFGRRDGVGDAVVATA